MTILQEPIATIKREQLELIYTSNSDQQEIRYSELARVFLSEFGRRPEFFVRSPGRVNLIGEHIDYSGYSVMPMAIDRDTVMAVGVVDDPETKPFVHLVNLNSKYPTRRFVHEKAPIHVTIDSTLHEWSNYFKCGYKAIQKINHR